jgi:dipeptidyl aminopeptidase/acylaminoacyl peptidase
VIEYTRKTGGAFRTLYLPAGYDKVKKEKLPLIIWAYPAEFKKETQQDRTIKILMNLRFPYYGSFVYWVTRGYVVLDDASFPIIGEEKTRTE